MDAKELTQAIKDALQRNRKSRISITADDVKTVAVDHAVNELARAVQSANDKAAHEQYHKQQRQEEPPKSITTTQPQNAIVDDLLPNNNNQPIETRVFFNNLTEPPITTISFNVLDTPSKMEEYAEETKKLPFVMGCPNTQVRNEIDSVNRYRLRKGMTLFVSYAQYKNYDLRGIEPTDKNTGMTIEFVTKDPRVVAAPVYCVGSQDYYLMFHNNKVFYLGTMQNKFAGDKPVVLKATNAANNSAKAVLSPAKLDSSRDLTRSEMMDLVSNKVSADSVLKRYAQYRNTEGVLMDLSPNNVKTVW